MSKLLKFKQVLSLDEASTYINTLTGEKPTDGDYDNLFYHGHIAPIIGYREPLYGFTEEEFIKLSHGESARHSAFSYIGVPCEFGGEIDGVSFTFATTLDAPGNHFYFAKGDWGAVASDGLSSAEWLSSLDPQDKKNWGIPTFQAHEIATAINSDTPPLHPMHRARLTIEFHKEPGLELNVLAIHGLQHLIHSGENPLKNKHLEKSKSSPSYKMTIAALLEITKSPRKTQKNQAGIISEILELYPNTRGLSKRNLEEIFGASNKAMIDAE